MLGTFVKLLEVTKVGIYTSYERICVYMNVACDLLVSIIISYHENECIHTLDYEHIPFMCRKCHEYGHMFRDFPQNVVISQDQPKQ
jgi:hypothetical protein